MKVENLNTPFYIVGNSSNLEKRRICDYIYIYIYLFISKYFIYDYAKYPMRITNSESSHLKHYFGQ